MSIPELEEAFTRFSLHNILAYVEPVRSTRGAPRMDDPRQRLLADGKPTDGQLESQQPVGYGTVDAPSRNENGSSSVKTPSHTGHSQASEDPAIEEARRSVKRALPILAIGVRSTSLHSVLPSHQFFAISGIASSN